MKIACAADLHGHLPQIPDADLCLLAGDYSPNPAIEFHWLCQCFRPWLTELCERMPVIGVGGNHDFLFEKSPAIPYGMPWTYLCDTTANFGLLKIFGSPYQPIFMDWAFNAKEGDLAAKWAAIPDDADVLLLHGPPHGFGDYSNYGKLNTGSPSLTARIRELKPKLVVCGHIHEGHGRYSISHADGTETVIVNCSLVDEKYKPIHEPTVIEL